MIEIKVTIEAPDLSASINNLAEALKNAHDVIPGKVVDFPAPVAETPVEAPEAPVTVNPEPVAEVAAVPEPVNPTPVNVTGGVNGEAPVTTSAPTVAAPTPVQTETVAPVPAATSEPPKTEKVITADDIARAGASLLNEGKMPGLIALLAKHGVQAITQLKPEQYADVAAGLRELGANI